MIAADGQTGLPLVKKAGLDRKRLRRYISATNRLKDFSAISEKSEKVL
jgi:hypothetical protein